VNINAIYAVVKHTFNLYKVDINAGLTCRQPEFFCVISGFCHEVDENCFLLGHYAASSCNSLLSLWDNPTVPSWRVRNPRRDLGPWIWTDRLSQNVNKEWVFLP